MGRAFEYRKARKFKRWGNMSRMFTRYGREITMAVKEGGSNPEYNTKLRAIIQNAKKEVARALTELNTRRRNPEAK